MEIEDAKEVENEFDNEYENGIILQSDIIKYDDAYKLNNFESCDMMTLIEIMSKTFDKVVQQTDQIPDQLLTVFHAKRVPSIGIGEYIIRVVKYARCSVESLVLALIYIDRLMQFNQGFLIKSVNLHRIFLTAVVLAAKFFDDFFFSNEYYAKIGGISTTELNSLEIEYLNSIRFSLYVDPIIFFQYRERILSQKRS